MRHSRRWKRSTQIQPGAWRRRGVGWLACLVVALGPSLVVAAPEDQDVFEDFEGFTPSTMVGVPFEIGPSGGRAEFGGNAFAGPASPWLTRSGTHAWQVVGNPAGATITFLDVPATEAEFYASVGTSPFGMIITAFDPVGTQIGSPVVLDAGAPTTLVSFTGPIGSILVVNSSPGDLVSVDDFGYSTGASPVPLLGLPGIAVLAGVLALTGWLFARGRIRDARSPG